MAARDTVKALAETFGAITRAAGSPALIERIRELSGVGLHRSALVTLWRLANSGPQLISELADGVGVDASTMSRLLRQLEREGLVKRGRDASDLRCVQITITAAGRRAHERVAVARSVMLTEVLDGWQQEDRDAFVLLLERFSEGFVEYLDRPQATLVA